MVLEIFEWLDNGILIRERLDRFLVTRAWMDYFPGAYIEHLVRYKSDHAAILLRSELPGRRRVLRSKKKFRFETCWLLDEACEGVAKRAWEAAVGSPIQARFEAVARDLVAWSKEGYGKLPKL